MAIVRVDVLPDNFSVVRRKKESEGAMRVLEMGEIQSLLATHAPGVAPVVAGQIEVILGQSPSERALQLWLETDRIVSDGDTRLRDAIFTAMQSPAPPSVPAAARKPVVQSGTAGTTRAASAPVAQPAPFAAKSSSMFQRVLLLILLCALGACGYLLWDISGQVETLKTEVADLRGFFYMTQVQRKDDKGQLLWKCQKDKNGEIIRYANSDRCLLSDEPATDEFPPRINGLISKAIEDRALSVVDLAIQAKLGDFLAVLERGRTDPASVPEGGLATLDECLAVADGGSLPQAAACCARTPILTQTSCRIAIRCKLDTMAPPEICPRK